VGGIRDKVVAAVRAGASYAIIPEGNRADVADVPEDVLTRIQVIFVSHASEALEVALAPGILL
jgi:ATP-dependent Lon protease